MLYALSELSAKQLRPILAAASPVPNGSSSGLVARQTVHVRVTGAAVSGWYPGVVTHYVAGGWEDLGPCEVTPADPSLPLASGTTYEARRTTDNTNGTARFLAVVAQEYALLSVDPTTSPAPGWLSGHLLVWLNGPGYTSLGAACEVYVGTGSAYDAANSFGAVGMRIPDKADGTLRYVIVLLPIADSGRYGLMTDLEQSFGGIKHFGEITVGGQNTLTSSGANFSAGLFAQSISVPAYSGYSQGQSGTFTMSNGTGTVTLTFSNGVMVHYATTP